MAPVPENRRLPKKEGDLFKSILVSGRGVQMTCAVYAVGAAVFLSHSGCRCSFGGV